MYSNDSRRRFLRYVFRRKQCTVILFLQIAVLILLLIIIVVLHHSTNKLNEKYLRLSRENDILAQYANFSAFFSCEYYPPAEYDVSECGWASDESSFMIRYYQQRTDNNKCASLLDIIPCDLKYPPSYKQWQNVFKNKILNTSNFISKYRPCPGIFNNTIGKYGISPQTPILAPKIKNMNQLDQGFMLRPKDFIMRCPICMISSRFSSAVNIFDDRNMQKNYCARSVKTLREGWPQEEMACDEIENHQFEEFCNIHDAIMNKIRDIRTPVIDTEANYNEDFD
ncbi:hypothetical protein ACH3XW_29850 [Acanthocheilonema viteae]